VSEGEAIFSPCLIQGLVSLICRPGLNYRSNLVSVLLDACCISYACQTLSRHMLDSWGVRGARMITAGGSYKMCCAWQQSASWQWRLVGLNASAGAGRLLVGIIAAQVYDLEIIVEVPVATSAYLTMPEFFGRCPRTGCPGQVALEKQRKVQRNVKKLADRAIHSRAIGSPVPLRFLLLAAVAVAAFMQAYCMPGVSVGEAGDAARRAVFTGRSGQQRWRQDTARRR